MSWAFSLFDVFFRKKPNNHDNDQYIELTQRKIENRKKGVINKANHQYPHQRARNKRNTWKRKIIQFMK